MGGLCYSRMEEKTIRQLPPTLGCRKCSDDWQRTPSICRIRCKPWPPPAKSNRIPASCGLGCGNYDQCRNCSVRFGSSHYQIRRSHTGPGKRRHHFYRENSQRPGEGEGLRDLARRPATVTVTGKRVRGGSSVRSKIYQVSAAGTCTVLN